MAEVCGKSVWQKYVAEMRSDYVSPQALIEFLAAPHIAKVGVGIADDLKVNSTKQTR